MRKREGKFFFMFCFLLLCGFAGVQQGEAGTCALCRQTLAMGGNEGLVRGFYWSILLIAGMPILIFIAAGIAFCRMRKKIASPPTQTFD